MDEPGLMVVDELADLSREAGRTGLLGECDSMVADDLCHLRALGCARGVRLPSEEPDEEGDG